MTAPVCMHARGIDVRGRNMIRVLFWVSFLAGEVMNAKHNTVIFWIPSGILLVPYLIALSKAGQSHE